MRKLLDALLLLGLTIYAFVKADIQLLAILLVLYEIADLKTTRTA